jgi:protein-tyrosine-phosphatase
VLVVCTANAARSPLFAARLRLEAGRRRQPDAVEVTSGGVETIFGAEATPAAVAVAERWGVDLTEHSTTPISYLDLGDPALIVTMERAHTRRIVELTPAAEATTFTLPELLAALERAGAGTMAATLPVPDPADPRPRLEAAVALAHLHRPARLRRKQADVPDPVRGGQEVFDALGARFEVEAATLAEVLFGPVGA